MEKLTSILLVLESINTGTKVLEKTISLARHFGARVEVLLGAACDAREFASLCKSRGYDEAMFYGVPPGRESLAGVILELALERLPDLVVKARPLSGDALCRDDLQLAAACPVPLMLMSERAWRTPVRIAAAVDISGDDAALARTIVHTSGLLSTGVEGDLEVLYSEREQHDDMLRMARAVRLSRLVWEFHVDGQRIRHTNGVPEETLPAIAASGEYDIFVVGALTHHEGSASWRAMLTRKVVAAFDGDVVLVKEDVSGSARQSSSSLKHRAAL
jgi:hypothetical protein